MWVALHVTRCRREPGAALEGDGEQWLKYVAELWQVDEAQLLSKLVNTVRQVGGDSIESPLTAPEANTKRCDVRRPSSGVGVTPPPARTRACPNTATLCFRAFGPFL